MEHKRLVRQLRKLAEKITKHIDSPNFGGCGVIAGIVGKHLQQHGYMVEVVTPCDHWDGLPAAKVRANVRNVEDVSEWDDNGLRRSHLAVRFRSNRRCYTWDSDGLRLGASKFGKEREYETTKKFGDGLSVDECIRISSSGKNWNSTFDRSQIPKIRHLAEHYLKFNFD
jgi:hypothetical protein